MKKETNIHGIRYTIELIKPDQCKVTKHASKELTFTTGDISAYNNIDRPKDKYKHLDAKRHFKGLFLI